MCVVGLQWCRNVCTMVFQECHSVICVITAPYCKWSVPAMVLSGATYRACTDLLMFMAHKYKVKQGTHTFRKQIPWKRVFTANSKVAHGACAVINALTWRGEKHDMTCFKLHPFFLFHRGADSTLTIFGENAV